jgi:hypothetical protein
MKAINEETSVQNKAKERNTQPKRAEIIIVPPISFSHLAKLRLMLQQFADLRVLSVDGSLDNGTQISIQMNKPISLIDQLRKMPIVLEVLDEDQIESHQFGGFIKKSIPTRSQKLQEEQRILVMLDKN